LCATCSAVVVVVVDVAVVERDEWVGEVVEL